MLQSVLPFAMEPRAQGTVTVAGGRTLGYAEFGPTNGVPVVFIPGAATSRLMNFGGALLEKRGVRLISVDRPGLGWSSHDPGATFLSVAADVEQLLSQQGVVAPMCVANSQGGPFGLACARRGVVSGVVLVSPSDEVAHGAVEAQLSPELRDLGRLVRDEPETAEALFAQFDADAMFALTMNAFPDSDAAVYGRPEFVDLYRRALEQGFAQGAAGYAHDTLLAMSPWPLDLDGLGLPVSIWFGLDDVSHSPDQGTTLARRIRGSQLHQVAGVGGSLLWRSPELILDDVLGASAR